MKKYITDIRNNIYLKESNIRLKKIRKYIENNVIIVYKNEAITKFLGMGASITESSGYNYSLLSDSKKKDFINDIYGIDGLNYNIGRLSIGSCDFSLSFYEYSKKKDLSDFSIGHDKLYIIPLLNDIYKIKKLTLISSPWTPPKFMKSFKCIKGSKLKQKYYELYAMYLHKYIDSYKKIGFDINYITIQNEPMVRQRWESCKFSLENQKKFIYEYLLDELKNTETSIILWDHNRENIYDVAKELYEENEKVKGLGFHWYSGRFYNNIRLVRNKYPDLLLFNTEMCCGYSNTNFITWMADAELYIRDIISCMNSGINAYLEWNLLLDFEGGPSHIKNPVKTPIVLNNDKTDYIKTPIYYYIKHISNFIKEGYEIINSDKYEENLYVVSAKKDNKVVVVILNLTDNDYMYNLLLDDKYLNDTINGHTIITYVE